MNHPRAGIALMLSALATSAAAQTSRIAITHVSVIDVDAGRTLSDRTVIIEGSRIRSIGPGSAAVPAGATVIDGRGRFLMPGLWDMHVHLGMTGRSALALLLANGVTGVRDMGGGLDQVRSWRDSIRAGTLPGPDIEMTGPIVENARWRTNVINLVTQLGDTATARDIAVRIGVSTPEEARAAVEHIAALGVLLIKLRNDPPGPAYFALLSEARRRGMRVVGHPPFRSTLAQASDSGQASIEHGVLSIRGDNTWVSSFDAMTAAERSDLFSRFARNRTALVPTLIAGIGFRRMPDSLVLAIIDDSTGSLDPRRRYASPRMLVQWRNQMQMKKGETGPQPDWFALHDQSSAHLRALDSAGVMVLAGTDLGTPLVYPGFGLHDELVLQVKEGGRTPARALWGATLGPARFFDLERELGTVAAGKRAELVLLDANPLEDIEHVRRIRAVLRGGKLLDRAALDALLVAH